MIWDSSAVPFFMSGKSNTEDKNIKKA